MRYVTPSFRFRQDPIGDFGDNHVWYGELPDRKPLTSGESVPRRCTSVVQISPSAAILQGADIHLDESVVAGLTTRLLDFRGPKHLALDRTNWKLGKTDINILVLAVVTPKFKIPVMWSFMDHRGNSSTSQRIDLMKRYIDVF